MSVEGEVDVGSLQSLGSRIVQAARLAVAMHLFASVGETDGRHRRYDIDGTGPVASDPAPPRHEAGPR